jgi:glyoxylase-like metal-dependent hydrolase (beta-lactamase superfamily II)
MKSNFHSLKVGWTNDYLLKCSGGYLLIDTGFSRYYDQLVAGMNRIGLDASQIKHLLLTHHHDDHSGFAARLIKQTHAQVIVHQDAAIPLSKGAFEFPGSMRPVNPQVSLVFQVHRLITGRDFKFSPIIMTDQDRVLSGDDTDLLKSVGVDGRILYTPGHSKDSISVLLSDGNAFVGDLAMDFLNFLGCKYRPVFFEDIHAVLESWRKLIEAGAKMVHPAHGGSFPIERLIYYRSLFVRGTRS